MTAMKKKNVNTTCPYCGSKNMTADCDIRITGVLDKKGHIRVKDFWLERETLEGEAIMESADSDIHGFCEDCGEYCDFDWKKGFVKIAEK